VEGRGEKVEYRTANAEKWSGVGGGERWDNVW